MIKVAQPGDSPPACDGGKCSEHWPCAQILTPVQFARMEVKSWPWKTDILAVCDALVEATMPAEVTSGQASPTSVAADCAGNMHTDGTLMSSAGAHVVLAGSIHDAGWDLWLTPSGMMHIARECHKRLSLQVTCLAMLKMHYQAVVCGRLRGGPACSW